MGAIDISILRMLTIYALLIVPAGLILWLRLPMLGQMAIAVVRMTVQLAFVGLYLQFVFQQNSPWLTALWLIIMIVVADFSILRAGGLRVRRFGLPLLASLVMGTSIPMFVFVGLLLARPNIMDAQYAIPISGMILGNCLRADIIGMRRFFLRLKEEKRRYELTLMQGAHLREAIRPYLRDAFREAITPTVASMATIGIVSLPGMMTGTILGGTDPIVAIKYQIAIMIAILAGTAITVMTAIQLALPTSFDEYGLLDEEIFRQKS